jgi:hypothetical protein
MKRFSFAALVDGSTEGGCSKPVIAGLLEAREPSNA